MSFKKGVFEEFDFVYRSSNAVSFDKNDHASQSYIPVIYNQYDNPISELSTLLKANRRYCYQKIVLNQNIQKNYSLQPDFRRYSNSLLKKTKIELKRTYVRKPTLISNHHQPSVKVLSSYCEFLHGKKITRTE